MPANRRAAPAMDPVSALIAGVVRDELQKFRSEFLDELKRQQGSAPSPADPHNGKIQPIAEVIERLDTSKTTLWRMIQRGEFPKPLQISRGRVGWRQEDVTAWLEARR